MDCMACEEGLLPIVVLTHVGGGRFAQGKSTRWCKWLPQKRFAVSQGNSSAARTILAFAPLAQALTGMAKIDKNHCLS